MASSENAQPAAAAEALERLGQLSLRELSMDSLLQTVAELASLVMPGTLEASVTLVVKGTPTTVASTGRLASELDERQYERDHGPCLHAARTGELTEVTDTRTDPRWPDYMRRAVEQGNLSSLSVPLAIDEAEQICGALNVYAREAGAFDDESRAVAGRLGPYAAVAAGNMWSYRSARDMADNLQAALESRAVIDQAKGVLMERFKVSADGAFQLLSQTSMRVNRKVRDIAEELVTTGQLPDPPPPRAGRPGPRPQRGRPGPPGQEHS